MLIESLDYDLKNPRILDQIVDSFNEKIIGESNNKKMIFLACISKDLPRNNRMSVIVSSSSSAGKSNLVNNVLEIFEKDLIDVTDFTQSWFMRSNSNLNGKILKEEQMEKTNDKGQVDLNKIKFSLSEGKVKIGISEHDEKGKWQAVEKEVTGIPVYLSTTTNPNINVETLNRAFLIQLDESPSQTARINEHTLKAYSTPNIENTWKNTVDKNIQLVDYFKEFSKTITQIHLPFAPKLKIPSDNLELRRDLGKILNLTSSIAFVHHANRIMIRDNKGEHVFQDQFGKTELTYRYRLVADIEDFREACEIGKAIFNQTLNKANDNTLRLCKIIKDNYDSSGLGMTVEDLTNYVSKSTNRLSELLRSCVDAGLLKRIRNSERQFVYTPTKKEFLILDDSIIPEFTHDDIMKWYEREYQGHSDRFEIKLPKS